MDERFLRKKRSNLENQDKELEKKEKELQDSSSSERNADSINKDGDAYEKNEELKEENENHSDKEKDLNENNEENNLNENDKSQDKENQEEDSSKGEEDKKSEDNQNQEREGDSQSPVNSNKDKDKDNGQDERQRRKDIANTGKNNAVGSEEKGAKDDKTNTSPDIAKKIKSEATKKLADKATGENAAAAKVQEIGQKVANVAKTAYNSTIALAKVVTSPIFWIIVALIIIVAAISSTVSIIGGNDYNQSCDYNGVGSVNIAEDADAFTRQSGIVSWLMSTPFEAWGNKPMSREQAMGVIGNLIEEGQANNHAFQGDMTYTKWKDCDNSCASKISGGGKALGILQWDSGRRDLLVAYAIKQGKPWHDLTTQLEFLKIELDGAEKGSIKRSGLNVSGKSIEDYTLAWSKYVERCGKCRNDERVASALAFDSKYSGGGSLGSSSVSTQCVTAGSVDSSSLVQLALSIAYTREEKAAGKGYGSCGALAGCGVEFSKPEYIEAKKMAEAVNGADPAAGMLASCDRLAATLFRLTGVDENFPWGGSNEQLSYATKNWQKVSCQERAPGDAIIRPGHIMVYIGEVDGKDSIVSASIALRSRVGPNGKGRSAHIGEISCKGDKFYADGSTGQGFRKPGAKATNPADKAADKKEEKKDDK